MTMPHADLWAVLLAVATLARIGGHFGADASGAGRTAVGDQGKDAEKTPAQKKSEAMKKHYEDPEFRTRQAQGSLETWKDPEYRKKISKARREQHARGQGGRGGGPK